VCGCAHLFIVCVGVGVGVGVCACLCVHLFAFAHACVGGRVFYSSSNCAGWLAGMEWLIICAYLVTYFEQDRHFWVEWEVRCIRTCLLVLFVRACTTDTGQWLALVYPIFVQHAKPACQEGIGPLHLLLVAMM
jgi:hypothetical protein